MGACAGELGDRVWHRAVLSWGWARAAIFRQPSRQRLSGFLRKSGRLPRAFSIRVRAWARFSRPLVVPWVALHFGWRAAFLVTGIFSAIWIVWWSIRYRKPQETMDWTRGQVVVAPSADVLPWWRLLRYRQTWGFMLGKFLTDPVWWFLSVLAAAVFQLAV